MKSLSLFLVVLLFSNVAKAGPYLNFQPVLECVTAQNPEESEILVVLQSSPEGATRLTVQFAGEDKVAVVPTKKVVPPKNMAGAPIQYIGKLSELNNKTTTLAVSARPVKNGKFKGKAAAFSIDQLLLDLPMICMPVK